MAEIILDSSILISYWKRCLALHRGPISLATASRWGKALRRLYEFPGPEKVQVRIVTPVYIEFVVWASRSEELRWFQAFLEPFPILDQKKILPEDWTRAQQFAE